MIELAMNKKISKWIRYPIMGIVGAFYLIIIVGLMWIAFIVLKNSFVIACLIILLDLFILLGTIIGFRKRLKQQI